MIKKLISGIFIFIFISCKKDYKIDNVERAFYYWKTNDWHLSEKQDSTIKNTEIKKLYVKFFEVEHNELMGNIPFSKNRMNISNNNVEIIPTVFLKNEVFLKSTLQELDLLADNINFLISKYQKEDINDDVLVSEYQMDCDWTIKSKNNYFYFLKKLKTISSKKISCTLRLYPYKYREKMGIPPVDKVTLMCYNLLNPLENPKQNSIIDVDELAKYLTVTTKYPIHTDIALPIYSWMQLYQNNQFQNVIYSHHDYLIKKLKKIDNLWYEVTEDVQVENNYIRIGDKIKYEQVTKETLDKAIKLLKKNIDFAPSTTIALFHLDDAPLQKYSNEEINNIYTSFIK